MTIRVNIELLN